MDSPRERRTVPLPALVIPLVLLSMWGVPRLLVAWLGQSDPWTAYLYQYLLGGMVFGVGLLVIRTSGACDFDRPREKMWFKVLLFGYLWYAALHAVVTWLATAVPFKGGA